MRAHERLVGALVTAGGAGARLVEGAAWDWASATFVGARHRVVLALPVEGADALLDGLDEREFALPGHLVADILVTGREDAAGEAVVAIEALTVEVA